MKEQFAGDYPIILENRINLGREKKQRFIEEEDLRSRASLKIRPSNIAYFESLMIHPENHPKKVLRIGYFCNMIPREILSAFDAKTVRLDCGNSALALAGEEAFSGDICPLAKASLGTFLQENSLANSCDLLILPTSCDAKRKMGEILNDSKPVFMLSLPAEQNHEKYREVCLSETKRLVKFLELHLKIKLSRKKLLEEIRHGLERTALVREIQKVRMENPRSLTIADFFTIIQSSLFRPVNPKEWLSEAKKVLQEIKSYSPERKSLRPKFVLTGAPMVWPNFKVLNILEECGADIVADTLCTGAQSCFDPAVPDEKSMDSLLRALNNRYIFASLCPCFVSQSPRLNRVQELVRESGAEGVINYSLRLCQLFDVENYRLERVMKQQKIPYANIRSDYSLEDKEQLRVRIEAFLETHPAPSLSKREGVERNDGGEL